MAAVAAPATPQRPIPGGFTVTPAPQQGSTIFAANAATLRQNPQPPASDSVSGTAGGAQTISGVQRAANAINSALNHDAQYPELESYIQQGISGEYDLRTSQAWQPFQKLKMYELPPRLLEQANQSGMGMQMGIFAPLNHAWIALDNCLYLWDYTTPNPEIIGFEENTQPITAVKLVAPKPGVFIADIRHMIVICTASEMLLLGVASQTTPTGAQTVALYNTRMSIPIRGIGVSFIEASKKSGRIFFTGSLTDDIFEFEYQQEEGWFRGKCSRKCHTKSSVNFFSENVQAVGAYFGPKAQKKFLMQMVIDDSRNLMYTLSNTSELKVWLIRDRLEQALVRPLSALLQNTGHFNSRTELLTSRDVALVSISAVSATESRRVTLLATTNTGCRLFLSITRGYGYQADAQNPPSSMQILHIRFPPRDPSAPAPPAQTGTTAGQPQVANDSQYLKPTTMSYRFSPGYWMAFQPNPADMDHKDRVFITAVDTARMNYRGGGAFTPVQSFSEFGQWINLPAEMQQVMPMTGDVGATAEPQGFGNELAVQFDLASSEFAIVTTSGIQTIRRRRLVDIFAAMLKYGSGDDAGDDGELKRFVQLYGRSELSATALAVACGQGLDVAENRVASVTEPEVVEKARKAFIDFGGKPNYNANADTGSVNATDNVSASPRHQGMATYISRLVRSIWRATVIKDSAAPGAGAKLEPTIKLEKLRSIQRSLASLREFLERNRSFIEGLAGPQALSKAATRQEEIALQGEHQAMHSLMLLIHSISEGISFVLVLFDEQIEEILALIPEDSRNRTRQLTFEALFVSSAGRDLAKELVKAIVNRNIANGSNVDTVAEALRRRCGSFCSADDVVIFKAQEQVKRASENSQTEAGRVLLNESARLFQKVAGSLTLENLQSAVNSYVDMAFFAGAIQLCLVVAFEKDKSKRALSWIRERRPEPDDRREAFQAREQCYRLIFDVIIALERSTADAPLEVDGKHTLAQRRRNEAYDIINTSDDLVFQTCLYDWYVANNQSDRLLDVENPFIVDYLKDKGENSRLHADLLWRYYAHHNDFLQAANVQLMLAQSNFDDISLDDRIGYLSRARTNASTRQTILTDSRQSKQRVLREVSDLLEIAGIQDEILQRIKVEKRIADVNRPGWIAKLSKTILPVEELFTQYADAAGYHDICILLYQVADHRNPADILNSWQLLINQVDDNALAEYGPSRQPWEVVSEKVRELGLRLHGSAATFPIQTLLPLLERYAVQPRESHPPPTWAIDIFLDLDIPHETLLPALEQLYYSNEHPFVGTKRKTIANKMVYLLHRWFQASERSGERVLFGSDENLSTVQDCLSSLLRADMDPARRQEAELLVAQINSALR